MMQISDLHRQAKNRLQEASGNPKKVVLLHTAVALGCSLLLTGMVYLFDHLIANTSGLGGLGRRSVLTTVQALLELVVMIALPFWQLGIYYTALHWAKGQRAESDDLLQGFRRFGPALKLFLMRYGLFLALAVAVFYACLTLFVMTPFSIPFLEVIQPIMEQSTTPEQLQELLTPELMESAFHAMIPLLILSGVIYTALAIILFYRLRFADFAVMDGMSAGSAFRKSFVLTRNRCMQVFRLDLSFWWFYSLQMLSVAICYTDVLLPLIGVSLPVSQVVAALAFYAIGILCQGVLLWLREGHRVTAYALAYRTLDAAINGDGEDAQP